MLAIRTGHLPSSPNLASALLFLKPTSMMQNTQLVDIPIELQSHILKHLSSPPFFQLDPSPLCTVETATWFLDAFPDDMLNVAKTSTVLLQAVINALGPQAKILSFRRSTRLAEWILLLKKHVKAVSLTGTVVLGHCKEGCTELLCKCDGLHKGILKTLHALYHSDVALLALNLEELAMTDTSRAEQIAEHAIKAIQRSSSSLKEIALSMNRASAIFMPRVTLPSLEVAQVLSEDFHGDGLAAVSDEPNPAKLCGDILQGINGHANRKTNESTVKELRLYNIHKAPTIDRESCSSLFLSVQNLLMMCGENSKHSEIARFIANFRNLKTLHWFTGMMCSDDMNIIFEGCSNLERLDLSTSDRCILPGEIDLAQNSSRLKDLFVSFRGNLRKFDFNAYLLGVQIKSLGATSPNLRTLEMEIDSENVGALSLLLGTHCRELRELRLLYNKKAVECLGRDGWPALAQAIRSASDKLLVISLVGNRTGPIIESAPNEMVLAIKDILGSFGDRASSIVFRVPINTSNPFVVLEALWQTLNVAKTYCRSMETLCFDFIQDFSFGGYWTANYLEDDLLDFFAKVGNLQDRMKLVNDQNTVDLGDIDSLWEEQWNGEDGEDLDEDMDEIPLEILLG